MSLDIWPPISPDELKIKEAETQVCRIQYIPGDAVLSFDHDANPYPGPRIDLVYRRSPRSLSRVKTWPGGLLCAACARGPWQHARHEHAAQRTSQRNYNKSRNSCSQGRMSLYLSLILATKVLTPSRPSTFNFEPLHLSPSPSHHQIPSTSLRSIRSLHT